MRIRTRPSILASSLILGLVVLISPLSSINSATIQSKISLIKGAAVRISKIDDWDFGVYTYNASTTVDLSVSDDECVFSTTGSFNLDVISQNGNALHLQHTTGPAQIPYTLAVTSRSGNAPYNTKNYTSSPISLKNRRGSQVLECADEFSGHNLRIDTIIAAADFNAAPTGTYQDTVTLIVSPK